MVAGDESLLLRNVVELFRLPESLRLRLLLRLSEGLLLLNLFSLSELKSLRLIVGYLGCGLASAVAGLLLLVGQETLLAVDLLLLGDVDKLGLTVGHRDFPDQDDNIIKVLIKV